MSQFNNRNGVPKPGTQSGMASAPSTSTNGSQNPLMSRLFRTPASQPLEDNSDSVVFIREKTPKRPRSQNPPRQPVPICVVGSDVASMSATSPASTISCEPSPERSSPGNSNSSPVSPVNQRASGSTPSPLASPINLSSPSAMQGRSTGQTEPAMLPPATIPSSQFAHPQEIRGRAPASSQNRTSSTHAQSSAARGIHRDQRPSVASHTRDHSGQSRRPRSPSLLSGVNKITQAGRHPRSHNRSRSQTVHQQTTETTMSRPQQQQITVSPQQTTEMTMSRPQQQQITVSPQQTTETTMSRPQQQQITVSPQQTTETIMSRPQQQQITVSSQQRPSTVPTLGGTKRNLPDESNSSAERPAKKRVNFNTLPSASGSAGSSSSVASTSRGSALASPGSTRSPTHLAPAGVVLGVIRQTISHTSQPKSVQSTAVAVASTSKGPHGSTSKGPHGSTSKGPHGSTSKEPHGSTSKGPHGSTSKGPHGSTSKGPHGSTSKGPHGSSSKSSNSSSKNLDQETVLDEAMSAFRKQLEGRLKRNFSRHPQEGLRYIKKFADRVSPENSGFLHLLNLYGHIDRKNYKYYIPKMWEELEQQESEGSNERQLAAMEKQLKELENKMKDFRKNFPKNEDQWSRPELNLYNPIAKKYTELYQRYVNESGSGCAGRNAAHKHLLEPIDLSQATEFPKINLLVEEYLNASKVEFKNGLAVSLDEIHSPYFKDIQEIVEQAVEQYKLGLSKDFVDKLARDIYMVVVKQNQAGRSMDSAREIYNYADLTDEETRERALRKDPALGSPDLQHKLERNGILGEMNMDFVMDSAVFLESVGVSLDREIDSIRTEMTDRDNDDDEDINDLIDRPNEVPEGQEVPEAPEGFYDDDDDVANSMETDSCSPANGSNYHTETTMNLNPRGSYFQR